ncbi:family 43 glycosylhydrolase [Paenibacillus sp. CAU 1782]
MSHAFLHSYIKSGDSNRHYSLCLAVESQGQITLLNDGHPVLFALNEQKKIGAPVLFRQPDGSLGLAAADHEGSEFILLYDCIEDWTFANERFIHVNASGIPIKEFSISYDQTNELYTLQWSDGSQGYMAVTRDWGTFSEPTTTDYAKTWADIAVTDAIQASSLQISPEECAALVLRYNKPQHTGFADTFGDITLPIGASAGELDLPSQVTAAYSDGSTKKFGVSWNTDSIDFQQPGVYALTGKIQQVQYPNPLIRERADPYIIYDNESGFYYFTASYPTYGHDANNEVQADGYDRIIIRRSRTLEGLATAEEIEVWNEENSDVSHRYIWAPELHKIGGKWYILCTASGEPDNVWGIRPIFIPCDGDVMDASAWSRDGHFAFNEANDGSFSLFSLDMTYFEHQGKHYVIWAEKPDTSRLYMATIDHTEPWRLTSPRMELAVPNYGWEQLRGHGIDEGPIVIKQAGRVYVFFSACTVDANYCMGYLHADENADLMKLDSWTKNPFPVLSTYDFEDGQQGPGHNSFTRDAQGNIVLCYHARTKGEPGDGGLDDPGRHARIKPIHFAHDGRPVLNMTLEEELKPHLSTITINITITD